MRWDGLFDDLEAQASALEQAERAAEVDERTRIEVAALHLADRLAAGAGSTVRLTCRGGAVVTGALRRVAPTWLLVLEGPGREALVPLAAVRAVSGLGRLAQPAATGRVGARLGLASALRAIARDRSPVRLDLVDAAVLDGTLDRVGADFVELAEHGAGEWRRGAEVRSVLLVATAELAVVRRSA